MASYRGRRLDGSLVEFHQAVDLLDQDTVPESYYLQVIANRVPRGSGGGRRRPDQPPARPNHGGADRRTDARQSSMEAAGRVVAGAMLDGQLGLHLSA